MASLAEPQIDHPGPVPAMPLRQRHDQLAQRAIAIRARRISQRGSTHTHDPEGVPLAQPA